MQMPEVSLNIAVTRTRSSAAKTKNSMGETVNDFTQNSLYIAKCRLDQLSEQDMFYQQGRVDKTTHTLYTQYGTYTRNKSNPNIWAMVKVDIALGDRIVPVNGDYAGQKFLVTGYDNPGGDNDHLEFRLTLEAGGN